MRSSPKATFPPLPAILAELGGAILGGLILAPVFYLAVGFAMLGSDLGMGVLSLQVFAAILGFGVGAGVGAALGGRLLGQRGSAWLAVLTSVLGGALVILAMRLLNVRGLFGILGVGLLVAPGLAIVGYNLRRGT